MKSVFLALSFMCLSLVTFAEESITVDQIFAKYFETTGGIDKWEKVEGLKMVAKINQGGFEIPLEIVQLKNGMQYTQYELQGNKFMQDVYDGSSLWSTNFQSLKAEKSAAESAANHKLDINDFPIAFHNYKAKGYTAELLGMEDIAGTETYKVKLTKEPKTYNGEKVADVEYYYFDTEYFVPVVTESEIKEGRMAGKIAQTENSDYLEVNGLYFPFAIASGIKGSSNQTLEIKEVIVNPTIDPSIFNYPAE